MPYAPALQSTEIVGHGLVEIDKELVGLATILLKVGDPDRIMKCDGPIGNDPIHGRCGELVTRKVVISGFNDLDDVARVGEYPEQILND